MTASTQRKGLILLAGDLHSFPIRRGDWDVIVAADGGAIHALNQGVHPDWIVGDFDSLSPEQLEPFINASVFIEKLPTDKDFTDGEAALQKIVAEEVTTVVLAGGLGGRFDHSLGNVTLLWQAYRAGVSAWVTDGQQRVFLLHDRLRIKAARADQLSIIPLTPTVEGLTISGVRWPLQHATLHFGSSRSLSNEFVADVASLSLLDGLALVAVTPVGFASL